MPYYEFDPDMLAEFAEMGGMEANLDESGKSYVPAETTINFESFDRLSKVVRDALVEKGFTIANCRYDGGNDEDFAYFGNAVKNGQASTARQLIEILSDSPIKDVVPFVCDDSRYPDEVRKQMLDRFNAMPVSKRIEEALAEFATAAADALLGEGFGTGEFSIRGRFWVDLQTGQVTDLEDA